MPAAQRQYAVLGPLTSAVEARAFLGCEVIGGAPRSDLPVVIVWLSDDVTRDPKQVSRLQRETAFVTQLKHPNIVRVYGLECFEEGWARVVAFVDGEPLARVLARAREVGQRLDPRLAGRIILDACEGVQHAHEEGQARYAGRPIVHGGLRPDTLFASYEGITMVTGFGAAVMGPTQHGGSVRDKYAYLAPEQIIGGKATASPTTDVYALGAILIELLTGKPPFADAPDIERAVLTGDPPSIDEPGLVGRLGNIASTALSKRGSDRFESVGAMRAAIMTAFGDEEVSSHDEIAVLLAGLMPINSAERAGRRQMLESARDPDSVTVLSRPTSAPEGVEPNLFEASRPGPLTGMNQALDPAEFASPSREDTVPPPSRALGEARMRIPLAREEKTIVDGRIPAHVEAQQDANTDAEAEAREEPTAIVAAKVLAAIPKQHADEAETELADEESLRQRSLDDERAELATLRGFHEAMTDEVTARRPDPPAPSPSPAPAKSAADDLLAPPKLPPVQVAATKIAAIGGTQASVPPSGPAHASVSPTSLASFPTPQGRSPAQAATAAPLHPSQVAVTPASNVPAAHPTHAAATDAHPTAHAQSPVAHGPPVAQSHAPAHAQPSAPQTAQVAPVQAQVANVPAMQSSVAPQPHAGQAPQAAQHAPAGYAPAMQASASQPAHPGHAAAPAMQSAAPQAAHPAHAAQQQTAQAMQSAAAQPAPAGYATQPMQGVAAQSAPPGYATQSMQGAAAQPPPVGYMQSMQGAPGQPAPGYAAQPQAALGYAPAQQPANPAYAATPSQAANPTYSPIAQHAGAAPSTQPAQGAPIQPGYAPAQHLANPAYAQSANQGFASAPPQPGAFATPSQAANPAFASVPPQPGAFATPSQSANQGFANAPPQPGAFATPSQAANPAFASAPPQLANPAFASAPPQPANPAAYSQSPTPNAAQALANATYAAPPAAPQPPVGGLPRPAPQGPVSPMSNGGQSSTPNGPISGTQSFIPGAGADVAAPRPSVQTNPAPAPAAANPLARPAGTRMPQKREESVITAFDRKVGDSSRSTLIVVLGAVALLLGGIFYFSEPPPEVKENADEEVRHNLPKDLVRAALEKPADPNQDPTAAEPEQPDPAAQPAAADPTPTGDPATKDKPDQPPPVVEKFGRIELTSDPEVDVYDGNTFLGRTPFTAKLETGPHKLRFTDKKTGINTYKNYKIKGGGLQRDHISFGTSELVVEAPDGASILLNQRFIGKAPLDPVKIYEGKYHLKVTLDGKSWADVFEAPAGRRINYRVTLNQ